MTDATAAPAQAYAHDPNRGPLGATLSSRVGYLLGLVRALITYGRTVSTRLAHCPPGPAFTRFARPFGTASLPLILARIACGLMRAAALQRRLSQRVDSGREIDPSLPPAPAHRLPASRADTRPAPRRAPRSLPPPDPRGLPSAEQIAAEARRQPVGAVIAAICRDFGMTPEQCGPALWRELEYAITTFGGRIAAWLREVKANTAMPPPERSDGSVPASARSSPANAPAPTAAATGPPPDWRVHSAAA